MASDCIIFYGVNGFLDTYLTFMIGNRVKNLWCFLDFDYCTKYGKNHTIFLIALSTKYRCFSLNANIKDSSLKCQLILVSNEKCF